MASSNIRKLCDNGECKREKAKEKICGKLQKKRE